MNTKIGVAPRLSDLVKGSEITPDTVARLAALALMQAHIVADELQDVVIPILPPMRRTHATCLVLRNERGAILEEEALRDVETFISNLAQQINAGTHAYWQGDDNHVRGGYDVIFREPEAYELAAVSSELKLLADVILATLCAARAVRETTALIDN